MNLSRHDYEEKRRYIRMRIEASVDVSTPDGRHVTGLCRNLSSSGMLLETRESVPMGASVEVKITPAHPKQSMFHASGIVTRLDPQGQSGFVVGIHISRIFD